MFLKPEPMSDTKKTGSVSENTESGIPEIPAQDEENVAENKAAGGPETPPHEAEGEASPAADIQHAAGNIAAALKSALSRGAVITSQPHIAAANQNKEHRALKQDGEALITRYKALFEAFEDPQIKEKITRGLEFTQELLKQHDQPNINLSPQAKETMNQVLKGLGPEFITTLNTFLSYLLLSIEELRQKVKKEGFASMVSEEEEELRARESYYSHLISIGQLMLDGHDRVSVNLAEISDEYDQYFNTSQEYKEKKRKLWEEIATQMEYAHARNLEELTDSLLEHQALKELRALLEEGAPLREVKSKLLDLIARNLDHMRNSIAAQAVASLYDIRDTEEADQETLQAWRALGPIIEKPEELDMMILFTNKTLRVALLVREIRDLLLA